MLRRSHLAALLAVLALALAAPATVRAQRSPDFSSMAGNWEAHGFSLDIGSDGQAVAHWRVYTWCNMLTQPAPCDSMIGNEIVDGGLAMLDFMTLTSNAASATVLMSSDPSFFAPGSTITLQMMPGGVAKMLPDRGGPLLCGPNFDPSAFSSPPCGA